MKTTKITILLVLMFVLALTAGMVAGRAMAGRRVQRPFQGSALSEELQLSPEQIEQMRPIWEAARDKARACGKVAEQIQREHEQQLTEMLTEDQKARYQKLSWQNHQKIAAQDEERKVAFRQAILSTKKILRPEQWRAYERILKNQVGAAAAMTEPASPAQ
jgi:hypothetical protein